MTLFFHNVSNIVLKSFLAFSISFFLFACEDNSSSSNSSSNSNEEEPNVSIPEIVACPETLAENTICDSRDGQIYSLITIDTQVWMAKNMNFNSSEIKSESWCYDNEESNCENYGRLYTWNVSSKICPEGFHVPSVDEFKTLSTYAENISGNNNNSLRSIDLWNEELPYKGTDDFGFSGVPGGRYYMKQFVKKGEEAFFWTSEADPNDSDSLTALIRSLSGHINLMGVGNTFKDYGLSIRCIKN